MAPIEPDLAEQPPTEHSSVADGLPRARRARAMAAVLTGIGLASLDTAIANTALPTIAVDLGVGPGAAVWVVNSYQLAVIAALLPLASLGDIIGQRRVFAAGLALFTAASLGCAAAWSLPSLVAARVVQGCGAAAIMAVNVALIRSVYPARHLGRGFGFNALVVGVGFAVGPTAASLILSVAPWPWLFAVNVPIGLLALALALVALPDTARARRDGDRLRFDGPGAALNAAAFALFVLALGEASHGAPAWRAGAEFAAALGSGWLLLRRQAEHPAPMLAADLLRLPLFALSAATAVGAFAAQGFAFVALPFLFEHTLGRSQVETGFLITPWPLVVAAMAPLAGRLSDRHPAGLLAGIGLALLAAGMALLALLALRPAAPDTFDIAWRMVLCGAGFGLFQAPNMRAIMTSAPQSRAGGASGIVATSRLLGQTTGAALVAACFMLLPSHGPALALGLGAGCAALAGAASFARLLVAPPAVGESHRAA